MGGGGVRLFLSSLLAHLQVQPLLHNEHHICIQNEEYRQLPGNSDMHSLAQHERTHTHTHTECVYVCVIPDASTNPFLFTSIFHSLSWLSLYCCGQEVRSHLLSSLSFPPSSFPLVMHSEKDRETSWSLTNWSCLFEAALQLFLFSLCRVLLVSCRARLCIWNVASLRNVTAFKLNLWTTVALSLSRGVFVYRISSKRL